MRKRNPYRFAVDTINRFRGLWQKSSRTNVDRKYTPVADNLVSSKIRQLDSREGQDKETSYLDGVIHGGRTVASKFVGEGNNLFVEAIAPAAVFGIPDYTPPSTWPRPPWEPPLFNPVNNCVDWWASLSTPAENQKAGGVFPDCFTDPTTYDCESLWERNATPLEYRKDDGYPNCVDGLNQTPDILSTCADVWPYAPNLSSYEIAGNADNDISTGTDQCWGITCQDLWTKHPSFSAFEVAANAAEEIKETGGVIHMSDCWNTDINCSQLYAENPDFDEYRKTGAEYPDCWDFTTDTPTPTCEEFWALYSIPKDQQNAGIYPNCVQLTTQVDKEVQSSCTQRLWSFPTGGDVVDAELEEGYSDTTFEVPLTCQLSVPSNEIAGAFSVSQVSSGLVEGEHFYDYVNVDPPCRRTIGYSTNMTIPAGLEEGTTQETFLMQVTFSGIGTLNYPVVVNITVTADGEVTDELDWEDMHATYQERREILDLTPLPAFSTYDFTNYSTQYNFIKDMQEFIESLPVHGGSTEAMEMYGFNTNDLDTTADMFITWDDLKAYSLLTSAGWARKIAGVSQPEGIIQAGDDIGNHLQINMWDIFAFLWRAGKAWRDNTHPVITIGTIESAASGVQFTHFHNVITATEGGHGDVVRGGTPYDPGLGVLNSGTGTAFGAFSNVGAGGSFRYLVGTGYQLDDTYIYPSVGWMFDPDRATNKIWMERSFYDNSYISGNAGVDTEELTLIIMTSSSRYSHSIPYPS